MEDKYFKGNNHNKIIENGKSVLKIEEESIRQIKDHLDINFAKAANLILECRGTLIISGLGKSGLISRKISATFSSLGTPSTYIHPGDALHGDLGLIKKIDLIIMISYSGETEELVRLQSFLEEQGNLSILISGNKNSSLGHRCNIFINGYVEQEACNHNLAPTASSTVALAIGDALAVTTSNQKSFKKSDFLKNHPSGLLGKLSMKKVKDAMTKNELPICKQHYNIINAISIITKGCVGAAFIVDNMNKLVGIITDGDLRRGLENKIALNENVNKIMKRNPIRISPEEELIKALEIMQINKVSVLPVTIEGKVVGAIQLINCK